MSDSVTVEKKPGVSVSKFTVEFDNVQNSDVHVKCLHYTFRGAKNGMRRWPDKRIGREGEDVVPLEMNRHWSLITPVPGQHLTVDPAKGEVTIHDPLTDDPERLKRIHRDMRRPDSGFRVSPQCPRPIPTETRKLDQHRMKTLCREILMWIEEGSAKVVEGPKPHQKAIDALPGRYLLNPGAQVRNYQPVFEDQWEKWLEEHEKFGG